MNNSLECKSPADIYLLLKSSTFVAHDLTNPFNTDNSVNEEAAKLPTVEYELVLRRWHNLNPAGEFRCFVRNEELIGDSSLRIIVFDSMYTKPTSVFDIVVCTCK